MKQQDRSTQRHIPIDTESFPRSHFSEPRLKVGDLVGFIGRYRRANLGENVRMCALVTEAGGWALVGWDRRADDKRFGMDEFCYVPVVTILWNDGDTTNTTEDLLEKLS